MEHPEDKIVIMLILLADILYSIVREIIALAVDPNDDQRGAGVASLAVLCGLCMLAFIVASLTLLIMECACHHEELAKKVICRRIVLALMQSLAACLYFYGDNIGYIMQRYGEALGCNNQCITNNRIAAAFTLGTALILLQLTPHALHKLSKMFDWEDNSKSTKWYSSLDMITVILKVDILYTAVVTMSQTDEFCGHIETALSTSFIILCMIIGIVTMIIYCSYSANLISDLKATKFLLCCCVVFGITLVLYMLADNEQPIGCAFNCDTFAANQTISEIMGNCTTSEITMNENMGNCTMNESSCNITGSSGLRLVFMLVALFLAAIPGCVLVCIGIFSEADDNVDSNHGISNRVYPVND